MVTWRISALVLLAGGCGSRAGDHYELRVHPTAAATAGATSLHIDLRRSDGSDSRGVDVALPRPTPSPPWVLDVQSGAWGAAPFDTAVEARSAQGAVARGTGTPAAGVIDVQLADVTRADGGMDLAFTDGVVSDLAIADASAPDLIVDLAAPPDLACVVQKLAANADADTIIGPGAPMLNFGGAATANVGVGISSVGLFRFDVTALPANARIQAIRLAFTFVPKSTDCAPACGLCNFDATGTVSLFYLRGDWAELGATWINYDTNKPWSANGASQGGVDRSAAPIANAQHMAMTNTAIDVQAADFGALPMWRTGNKISFALVPSNGAVFVIATRENPNQGCGNNAAPHLEIDWCP